MRKILLFTLLLSAIVSCKSEEAKYETTWESLVTHNERPEWFKDAKLGVYFHWGVYSVPAFQSEWYPRYMYLNVPGKWGYPIYEHHRETYGSDFNYHDFIPKFTAEKFDPAEWSELIKSTGAKFAGPVAIHHDGFAMWDSKINMWNALDMGPKRNVLGEMFTELRKRGLKTIATFHHAATLQRADGESADKDLKGKGYYPYSSKYATSSKDEKLKYLYGNISADEFYERWLGQINEVISEYKPDIIWFDSDFGSVPEEYKQKAVALQYNSGAKENQQTIVTHKGKALPDGVGLLDIEQGGMKELADKYWMTDITLSYGSWCYVKGQKYKELNLLARNMIDVWSKKGVVLLNLSPRSDGVIVDSQREVLDSLGKWIKLHSEAIYNTRSHYIYGYGTAQTLKGHYGGQSAKQKYSADDIRFTKSKDDKTLYLFVLGMPAENKTIVFDHISNKYKNKVKKVSLLSSKYDLDFEIDGEKLTIKTPEANYMDSVATVFKIEF
ncbi:MAG: alpha-L-fucosidase [Rikenellaceae bacterium]